jgi:hypothetical protein
VVRVKKLKMPKAEIEFEVRDKDGKLVRKGKMPANSWVGNIIGLLSSLTKGATSATSTTSIYPVITRADLKDVAGAAKGLFMIGAVGNTIYGGEAPSGSASFGIKIGTNDLAVTLSQVDLQASIAHGTGAGQMLYGATTVESLVTNASWYFRVIRTFTNNSGGTVTVREMGMFLHYSASGVPSNYYMLARDVLPSPINVANGQTLTLRYIVSHSLA